MSWQKVKINTFLKERKDRFKPDVANELGLKRIHKIDFSGNIHILEKLTNTGMILIKKGDLVISGINVEKGALAVYEGQEDVLATIHYSSYEYDKDKIDVDYLKWFLKSNLFKTILLEQVGGGIKTELKPKRFLPFEINLPDLKTQIEIKNKILAVEKEIEEIENKIGKESFYLIKLKEAILQEAVQGKLVEQNPEDEPASILLEKIKKEKEQLIKEKKIKKEKPLPEITKDEIPYELPNGWEWCRTIDTCSYVQRGKSPKYTEIEKKIPVISQKCVQWKGFDISRARFIEPDSIEKYDKIRFLNNFDLLWNSTGDGTIGRICLFENDEFETIVADSHVTVVRPFKNYVDPKYLLFLFSCRFVQDNLQVSGSTKQTELGTGTVKNHYFHFHQSPNKSV